MRRNSQHCLFSTSALESRQLLAGNVQAAAVGGTLKITGDIFANELAIAHTPEGLKVQAIGGTRLNGIVNGEQLFVNPVQTDIDLKWGNDVLSMAGFLGGGVSIQMGFGNDQVNLNAIHMDGDLMVDLSFGNDRLGANWGGPSQEDPNVVGGNVKLLGGWGSDRLMIKSLNALQNLTVDAGFGNDVLLLGSGSTELTSSIDLGFGNDIMSIQDRTSRGLFSLKAGYGNDLLGIHAAEFHESATFDMGGGMDAILSQNNYFQVNVTRAGGWWIDTLYSSGDGIVGDNTITGFENRPTNPALVQPLFNQLQAALA